jgi:putative DNA primase/helicase
MTNVDLLSTVQPPDGWFALLCIRGDDVRQELVATREELDTRTQEYVQNKWNVYFGVAKFETNKNRLKDNVKALKAFWLDIDCGEDKAEINPKTGRPDGYIDQATGMQELQRFCKLIGLPKPILVNSGRGIHVYWALTEPVTRGQWEPVADRLRELCVLHNFHIDGKVFEVARVLRIPGTYNFKDEPPTQVEILGTAPEVEYQTFRNLLGVKEESEAPPKRELSALAKSMMVNSVSSFKKIMIKSAGGTGCPQLLSAYEDRESLSEPRWFDALSIAKFCEDRDTAIHKMSQDHPDYDYHDTEHKVRHILGPHSCVEFEKSNPGGCDGCAHKGKIKSPISLGKEILEATEEDNEVTVHSIAPLRPRPTTLLNTCNRLGTWINGRKYLIFMVSRDWNPMRLRH